MITCSPPRFALQPSRVIDASSHPLFRAAGVLGCLLAVLGVALLHAGEAKLANPPGVAWLLLVVRAAYVAALERDAEGVQGSARSRAWRRSAAAM
jgi:hypothetical protein